MTLFFVEPTNTIQLIQMVQFSCMMFNNLISDSHALNRMVVPCHH